MRMYKKFTFIVNLMVIVSFLYSDTAWALPNLGRETLGPLSSLVEEVARVDINASFLLSDVFHRFLASEGEVDLGILFEWINTSRNLHETLAVQKQDQKILILARGFNIEFSTAQLEGGKKLPRSDIWVRINYYTDGEIRRLDLAAVINQTDEEKDRLIDELAEYINSGADRGLVLLGNFFDVKGVFNALARRGISDDKLKRITTEGGMPNVYRRTLEHRYVDGDEVKTIPITIEEFSPFFERDRRRIEELEIEAWKAIGVAVKPEEIRERYYRNPIYIIREGERIAGGIATSWLDVGGPPYERNIPKKYELLIEAHNPRGDTIFDFSVFTDLDPDIRKKKYGDILALATLEVAKLWGRREVIAASRAELFAGLVIKSSKFRHEINQLPKKEQFRAALEKIDEFLEALRRERGLPSDYSFTVEEIAGDILDYFFNLRRGKPLVITDRLAHRFTRYHLDTGDLFLDSFHHRLGARDVLEVLGSRPRDIRGLGANVYTSYYDTLKDAQLRCATPGDRAELEKQIFGRYYELIERRRKGFRGDIKSGIPGRMDSDPTEITEDPARTVEIGLKEDMIHLEDDGFARFIRGNFPGVDAGRIRDVICECFRKRKELFDPDGVNWSNLLARLRKERQKGIKAHFISGSKSLFGNHSVDDIAWANLPAIQHLISRIDDRQTAGIVLGIVLGIGLSHEILGHEAGIISDGVLTFQDAVLTLEMVKGHNYGFLEYINYLRLILEEDSPYIRQLKAIYTLTDPDRTADGEVLLLPPVTWVKGEKGAVAEGARIAGGAITEISLVIKYPAVRPRGILLRKELDALSSSEQAPRYSRAVIKEPGAEGGSFKIFSYSREAEGHIEEIGSFNIKWIFGVPYIQFEFKKAYYHLMLSSRYAMAALVGSIVERFGLDIYRTQVLVEKPLLGVIPLKNGEEIVLIPVSEIGAGIEKPIDLNSIIIKQGIEERSVRIRELVKKQFYRWYTSNFTMAVINSKVLPIGYMDEFLGNVFLALEKILGLKTVSDEVKKRLLEKVSAIAFLPCSLGKECEFVFKSIGLDNGREQLSIAVNEDSNVLKDSGDLDRLVYAFVRFLGSSEKKMNISFGEVPLSPPSPQRGEDYSVVYLSKDIKLEFSSDGQIGRVWVKGNEVPSFLLEKLFPELRKTLGSLPVNPVRSRTQTQASATSNGVNMTLPAILSYDVTKQLRMIKRHSYRCFRHGLNDSYLELYAHLELYNRILGHGRDTWDALEIIFNLPDSIPEIDAFRQWLAGIDSIVFEQVEEGSSVTIDVKEENNKKVLIIKIPKGFEEGINQAYLISCILFCFYSLNGRGIEFDRIHRGISDVITSRKGSEANVLSIDAGNGLKVYIDKKGWVNAKLKDKDIPLILLEKLIPSFRRNILRLPKVRQFIGAAGFKFKGMPVTDEEAGEIIKKSEVEAVEEEILEDIERFLQRMASQAKKLELPDGLGGLIFGKLFQLMQKADELIRYISDKVQGHGGFRDKIREAAQGIRAERDVAMHEKLRVDIEVATPGGYPPVINLNEILASEVLSQFRAMRQRRAFKIFTPREKEDLEYFLRSPDQHTAAVMLRTKERAVFTEGECYILGPIWRYLSSAGNSKRLKMALILHEVVEEFLYHKNVHHLIAHYIAEMFERIVLGEPVKIDGDSLLDRAIKGYFQAPAELKEERAPPIRSRWIDQWLGQSLIDFAEKVPPDVLAKARERCLPPYYTGIIELIKSLKNRIVREALGISEEEALFLEKLLFAAFIRPESNKVELGRYIGGFHRDKYDFPALLNLYIASRLRPAVVYAAQAPVSTGDAGFVSLSPPLAGRGVRARGEGWEVAIPLPDYESDEGEFPDVHMHFFVRKVADVIATQSGQRLNRKRLINAIEDVVYQMQVKDPDILKRFFSELKSLDITFSSEGGYLFKYNKAAGKIEINLDALLAIDNPEIMEVLVAVGLFGHLFLGYTSDTIDMLRAWQGSPGRDEKRDVTPSGILTRQDVENTMCLLGRYRITPGSFVYRVSKIAAPGERYPEGIAGYTRSPIWEFLARRFGKIEITQKAIPQMAAAVRKNIYAPQGDIALRLPSGIVIETFYKDLARAISEEVLSLHLPAGIRVEFIEQFAKGLTEALMYSAMVAGGTGGDGEWNIRWDIRDNKVFFSIKYPVGWKREIPKGELDRLKRYFDEVRIESGFEIFLESANETILVVKKWPLTLTLSPQGRGMGEGAIPCGMIGKDVPSSEVEVKDLDENERRMVSDAIANIERILSEKGNDEGFRPYIKDIEGYIRALKKLLGQGRIFKFDAIVREPEKFILGFADKKGRIALCNEFFQQGADLNSVLDEALFHEVYHLKNIHSINPHIHDEARRLQEAFFTDEIHYAPGDESLAKRSRLRGYAGALIDNRCGGAVVSVPRPEEGADLGQREALGDYTEYSGAVRIEDVPTEQLALVPYEAVREAIDDISQRLERIKSGLMPGEVNAIKALAAELYRVAKGEKRISKLYSFRPIISPVRSSVPQSGTTSNGVKDEDSWIVFFQDPSRGIAIAEEFFNKEHPRSRFLSQILFHLGYHMQGPDLIALGIRDVHKNALRLERILFDDEDHYLGTPDFKICQLAEAIRELVAEKTAPPGAEAGVPEPEPPISAEPAPTVVVEPAPAGVKPRIAFGKGVAVYWEPGSADDIRPAIVDEDGTVRQIEIAIAAAEGVLGEYYLYEKEQGGGIVSIGHFIAYKKEGRSYVKFHISPGYLHYFSSLELLKVMLDIIADNLNLDINSLQVQIDNPAFEAVGMVRAGVEIRVPVSPLAAEVLPQLIEGLGGVSVEEGIRRRSVIWGGRWGNRPYREQFYYRRTPDFGIEICERMLPRDPQNVKKVFDMILAAIEAIQNCPSDRFADPHLRAKLEFIKMSLLRGIDKIIFMPSVTEGSDYSLNLQEREEEGRRQKVLFIHTNKLAATGFNGFAYIFLRYFFVGAQLSSASFAEMRNAITAVLGEELDAEGGSDIIKLLKGIIVRPAEQEPEYRTVNLGDRIKIEVDTSTAPKRRSVSTLSEPRASDRDVEWVDNYRGIGNVLIGERLVSFFFLERLFPELRGFILSPPPDTAVTRGRIRLPEERAVPEDVLQEDLSLLRRFEYIQRSGLVESEDIVSGKRNFHMFYRELNDVSLELEIEEGMGLDINGANEFWGMSVSAIDALLNLPDSGLINRIRNGIVNNFNIIRFEKGESRDAIDIGLQEEGSKVALVFKLPSGFIRAVDRNMLILCLLTFFHRDRAPGWDVERIPIAYFTDERGWGNPILGLYHDILGELGRPGAAKKSIRFKSGLRVYIDGRRRISARRDSQDIPLILLEKACPGFRREVLGLPAEEPRKRTSPAPASSPARIDISVSPGSPGHSELRIIPEYTQSSDRMSYRIKTGRTLAYKEYWMVKRTLHDKEFILLVQGEYSDERLAVELCNRVMTAIDAILNLPDDAGGIGQLKERIINGFSTIRLDVNTTSLGVQIEKKRQDIAGDILIFDLPFLDRRDLQERMSVDNFIFSLLYFFAYEERTSLHFNVQALLDPPLYLGTVDPRLNAFYRWATGEIARSRGYAGETTHIRIPPPVDMEELRWLDVYVNRLGCVTAKLGDINIPLFLLERQNPGFRRKILRLSAGHRAFQARLREQYIEKGAPVEELADVLEVGRKGELIKGKNFERFCELVDLSPAEVEEALKAAFKYRSGIMLNELQSAIQNLRFYLSGGYEDPFGNNKGDGIVTLNHYALREFPKDVRLIALAVGLSHEILGHEAGMDDEDILTAEDVDVTMYMIGRQLTPPLKYLSSLSKVIREEESGYFRLLDETEDLVSIIADKIMARDSGLALLNNLGILNILTNQQLDIPIYARFRSKGEAISYFKDRKKELLRLVVCYYILFADDILDGRPVDEIPNGEPRVTDEDIVRALVGKLKDTIGLKLSQREEEFLFAYMTGVWMDRGGWVSRTVERLDEGIRERLEGKIAARLESASLIKRPGVLYFDLDKILEADPIPAAMYVGLLERLSDVENYAVVIVNSYPDKSINQLLGKFPGLAKRLQRIMRKGIVLDAHRLEIGSGPGIGQRLIEEAIRLAKAKLKADEIPPENITLAIYAPNRWLYPEGFLRNFAVVIMSAKTIRLDEQQLRELEKFLPGIGRLAADNRIQLLTEELIRLREELDRLEEGEIVSSQA